MGGETKDKEGKEKENKVEIKENKEKLSGESEEKNNKENKEEEENKSEEELSFEENDDQRIQKIDISGLKTEIDGKEFMFEMLKQIHRNSYHKIMIEDSSIKNKTKIKSSLIRFVLITNESLDNDIHIKIAEKDITNEARENYYYPKFFIDYIKKRNISNFLNINRIRSDLSFLKNHQIGINIDVKKQKEYEI